MEQLELKVLELGCLYLDPYEFYSPNGKQVVYRYDIEDFYRYNCICHTVAGYHEEDYTAIDFQLESNGAQGNLGRAIIRLWRARLLKIYPKVNRMTVEDNKTCIKIYDNKNDVVLYMGWYDGKLTVTTKAPTWYGKPWDSINLKQYK